MKSRFLKAILATVMCTMLLGTQVSAANANLTDGELTNADRGTNGNTSEGTSGINDPIYRVVVPFELEFAIDAFEQQNESQVWSADFPVINRSNLDVTVDVAITVESLMADGTNDVIFVDSAQEAADYAGVSKALYMTALIPVTNTISATELAVNDYTNTDIWNADALAYINVSSTIASEADVLVKLPYNTAGIADTIADAVAFAESGTSALGYAGTLSGSDANALPLDVSSTLDVNDDTTFVAMPLDPNETTTLNFALAAATYQDCIYDDAGTVKKGSAFLSMDAANKGVSLYRFAGAVNAKADWIAGEVKARSTYSFFGMSEAAYDALEFTAHGYIGTTNSLPEFDAVGIADLNQTQGLIYLGKSNATNAGGVSAVSDVTDVRIFTEDGTGGAVTTGNVESNYSFLIIERAGVEAVVGALDSTATYYIYFTLDGQVYQAEVAFT